MHPVLLGGGIRPVGGRILVLREPRTRTQHQEGTQPDLVDKGFDVGDKFLFIEPVQLRQMILARC